MSHLPINRAQDGRVQLVVWRSAPLFEKARGELVRRECVPVIHTIEPWPRRDHRGFWRWDLRKPLPFDDEVADWIYIYHIFEHLNPPEGEHFIRELHRILKPGGIVRVSVADNEFYVRDYLEHFEKAVADPCEGNLVNYEWTLMRIIDQCVRDRPSGRMGEFLRAGQFDVDHIADKFGDILDPLPRPHGSRIARGLALGPKHLFFAVWRHCRRRWRGNDPRAWGECDRWANDRVYMRELSRLAGFSRYSLTTYDKSEIPGWEAYDFDRSVHGGNRQHEPSAYFDLFK